MNILFLNETVCENFISDGFGKMMQLKRHFNLSHNFIVIGFTILTTKKNQNIV